MAVRRLISPALALAFVLCMLGATSSWAEEQSVPDVSVVKRETEYVSIDATRPQTGIAKVDRALDDFAKQQADDFEQEILLTVKELKTDKSADLSDFSFPYEMNITSQLASTPRVVSVLWKVWSYTGGAHGSLDLVSANYDKTNGAMLTLQDLFADPQAAVEQFSREARSTLSGKFLDNSDEQSNTFLSDMLRTGTEPTEESFHTFILLPDGVRLHFPPYQVAPWAYGEQFVDVSLESLKSAKPNMMYWGK